MRIGLALVALLAAVLLTGVSPISAHSVDHSTTTARASVTRDRVCRGTAETVVHWEHSLWRARGCFAPYVGDTVTIDRRIAGRWLRQATLKLARGISGPWTYLGAAELTYSGVPDFIVSVGQGADWIPFSVIAYLHGSWQLVPFDSEELPTPLEIDALLRTRSGLVHSYVDACGCAGGPQTSIWYRFNGRRFVPTTPPGAAPKCTAFPLNHAAVLPGTPRYLGPPRWRFAPFHAARFACADGWALAVDSKRRFALFNQQAGRWHRASVGSLAFIGRDDEPFYALPTDLLRFLERRASRPSATSAPAHSGFGKG